MPCSEPTEAHLIVATLLRAPHYPRVTRRRFHAEGHTLYSLSFSLFLALPSFSSCATCQFPNLHLRSPGVLCGLRWSRQRLQWPNSLRTMSGDRTQGVVEAAASRPKKAVEGVCSSEARERLIYAGGPMVRVSPNIEACSFHFVKDEDHGPVSFLP